MIRRTSAAIFGVRKFGIAHALRYLCRTKTPETDSAASRSRKNEPTMKKAALFDMDGTLVDNTPAHISAFSIFCDRYGVTD